METVCVLLAVSPVRVKRTGERSYLRPGLRLLSDTQEFHMRVRAVERSAVPPGVRTHILPLVQMLAIVPLGVDVPRCGLILREWCISMSDFHNAKAKGAAEAAALEQLLHTRSRSLRNPQVAASPAHRAVTISMQSPESYAHSSGQRSVSPMQSPLLGSVSRSPQRTRSLSPEQVVVDPPKSLKTNTSGGALHVGGTWSRSTTGRSPQANRSPKGSMQQQPLSPRSPRSPAARRGGATPRSPRTPMQRRDEAVSSHISDTVRSASRSPDGSISAQFDHIAHTPPHIRAPAGVSVPIVGSAAVRSSPPLSAVSGPGLPPLPPPSPRLGGVSVQPEGEFHRQAKVVREMTPQEKDVLVRLTATAHDPGHRVMAKAPVAHTQLDYARGVSLEGPDGYVAASPPQSPARVDVPYQHAVTPVSPRGGGGVEGGNLHQWLIIRGMEKHYDVLNQHGVYLIEDLHAATDASLSYLPIGMFSP